MAALPSTRNVTLERATSEYSAFLDADDLWRPTMLEKQLAVLESDPTLALSFTNFIRFNHDTREELGDQFRVTIPAERNRRNSRPHREQFFRFQGSLLRGCPVRRVSLLPAKQSCFRASTIRGLRFRRALAFRRRLRFSAARVPCVDGWPMCAKCWPTYAGTQATRRRTISSFRCTSSRPSSRSLPT